MSETKAKKNNSTTKSFNEDCTHFIPVVCHFDAYTLLTKNGELIQTFEIKGLNSQKISQNLSNLRNMVRQAIGGNITTSKLAFWMHTIRRKEDLDDPTPYHSFFAGNVHEIWRKKNYWSDKYVNKLYISVVHDGPSNKIIDLNSATNSLSRELIAKFQEDYHDAACKVLTEVVNNIVNDLSQYSATKLGISLKGGKPYSDLMFLYRRIIQLNENECPLPETDISDELSSHQYAVGSDMLEVIGNNDKKFAAVMSIKEYQEVSSETLDKFLQTPVEMVATEVFYFVDHKEVGKDFKDQAYIFEVSKDQELASIKGLDNFKDDAGAKYKFCRQQISFMLMGHEIEALEQKIKQVSTVLAKIGIVHVREDINLEKAFWAQIPGNFSYLSRMSSTLYNNTAALTSIHNVATGMQYNPWGRAITLLRTELGTPYFLNFHNKKNETFTVIYGSNKTGRTTLMNFILSESDKYKPTIVHLSSDNDSSIFIKAQSGILFNRKQKIINPFLLIDNQENRQILFTFLRIITNDSVNKLEESQLKEIAGLIDLSFTLEQAERKFSLIITKAIQHNIIVSERLKNHLQKYTEGGEFYQVFEADMALNIPNASLISFNLMAFDNDEYERVNLPKDKKLMDQYFENLRSLQSLKASIIYFTAQMLQSPGNGGPKILAIDELSKLLDLDNYQWLVSDLADQMQRHNGALFVTMLSDKIANNLVEEKPLTCFNKASTKLILALDNSFDNIKDVFSITDEEVEKLKSIELAHREFLILKDEICIAVELSIGGLQGLVKILSSSNYERQAYKKAIATYGKEDLKWLEPLYNEFNGNG